MKRITLLLIVLLWSMAGHAATLDFSSTDTFQSALENNRTSQASTWVNPDADSSGTVVPLRTYQSIEGFPCREFQQTIVIGGREEQGYGTACRQPDGTWRIVSGEEDRSVPPPVEQRTTIYVRDYPPSYYPYGYYGYPYWSPFGFYFDLGYRHYDGGHHRGGRHGDRHHGGGHRR
jgi:hypothetical protein